MAVAVLVRIINWDWMLSNMNKDLTIERLLVMLGKGVYKEDNGIVNSNIWALMKV